MRLPPLLIVLGLAAGLPAPATAHPPVAGASLDRPLGMGRAPVVQRYGQGWEHRPRRERCRDVRRGPRHPVRCRGPRG